MAVTVYDLAFDEQGKVPCLWNTKLVNEQLDSGKYVLSLEWKGKQKTDVTIGKHEYGGLFLRMLWKEERNEWRSH